MEQRRREHVNIDEIQFVFSIGKATTDGIFVGKKMQGKQLEKQEPFFACVDLQNFNSYI